ncbi:endonuclease III, partial [Adlercreutzia equolifaciens]|uniref:endonuclease III domain-containing protein n=1 Tax=Adlercreutzia equolifaciens TaxID=446660 RepID=UPI003D18B42C|nr:endonuclease III [Adlercreutzia equolifaciens]
ELTVAVELSAQCTDAAVNKVTPHLFEAFPTPADLAAASPVAVSEIIHSLGFFRSKAKNLVALAQTVVAVFGGDVPADVDLLQKLPGVGRKTANCV